MGNGVLNMVPIIHHVETVYISVRNNIQNSSGKAKNVIWMELFASNWELFLHALL